MDDIFEALYAEAARLLRPFTQAAADGDLTSLLTGLGLNPAADGLNLSALQAAVTTLDDAILAVAALDGPLNITVAETAFDAVKGLFATVRDLPKTVTGPALPAALADAWTHVESELFPHVVAQWLFEEHRAAYRTLAVFGAISSTTPPGDAVLNADGTAAWLPVPVRSIDMKPVLALIRNPEHVIATQLLGNPPATGAAAVTSVAASLWPRLQSVARMASLPLLTGTDSDLRALLGNLGTAGEILADTTVLLPAFDDSGALLALTLVPPLTPGGRSSAVLTAAESINVDATAGPLHVTLTAAGTARALTVDTAGTVTLPPGAAAGDALTFTLTVAANPPTGAGAGTGSPTSLWRIGPVNGTHVELDRASLTGTAHFAPPAAGGGTAQRAQINAEADVAASLVLDFTDGDSFVSAAARLVLAGPVSVDAHAALGWAWGRSVYLRGGATITGAAAGSGAGGGPATLAMQTKIPVHLNLGPASVDTLTLAVTPQQLPTGHEQISIQTGIDVTLDLGALTAQVSNIGLQIVVTSADHDGNLGPLDAVLTFKPPDGAGIAIDAGPVSGGGYLAIDEAHHRYLGAAALRIGPVSVQGVAVLATDIPTVGWSLVALADVSGLSVQLGFGIELTGVGVLVGVHRTMNIPALQALARGGQLEAVLFPADLAANAPRVAAQLDAVFPTAAGEFVVGPIVQLSWGTSSLVTAELAVFIEFPHTLRIAVLGIIEIVLPESDDPDPVVDLQLDVLGVLDLAAKTVSLDMSLTHSSLAGMPLTGQAALRAGWGSAAAFLLAIGGVNPHFMPPAGFPALDRIGLTIGRGDLTIRLTTYLALSTNTVQFGAAVDLRAHAGPFGLTAVVSFDSLLQFKPFHLEVDLTIYAAVTVWGGALLCLDVTAHLAGPGPWRIAGHVRVGILFCHATISLSGTFGATAPQIAPNTVDVLNPLATAVSDPSNWTVTGPVGPGVITLRGTAASALLHPLGGLGVRQRVVPLNVTIDRFGPDVLAAASTYTLSVTNPAGGPPITSAPHVDTDLFAPGQFITASDTVDSPSFEPLTCGLTVTEDGIAIAGNPDGTAVIQASAARWERLIIPAPAAAAPVAAATGPAPPLRDPADSVAAGSRMSAAARAAGVPYRAAAGTGPLYGLRQPTYTYDTTVGTGTPGTGSTSATTVSAGWPLEPTHATLAAAAAAAGKPVQFATELLGQAGKGDRMTDPTVLSFLPWAVPSTALLPRISRDGTVCATLSVTVTETRPGAPAPVGAEVSIPLLDPGDVTGLEPGQVLRTDPSDDAPGVEPTLFPYVELTLPQLPWMFTAATVTPTSSADADLQPWLRLIVIPDSAQVTIRAHQNLLTVPASELPPAEDAWAWAHVQYGAALPGTAADGSGTVTTDTVSAAIRARNVATVARLICPRALTAHVRYHAAVVPTTTSGQAAGLGITPTPGPLAYAWPTADADDNVTLPYYLYFSFTTGDSGDFRSLAELLAGSSGRVDASTLQPGTLTVTWPTGTGPYTETMPTMLAPVTGTAATIPAAVPATLATWLTAQCAPDPSAAPAVMNVPAYGAVQAGWTPAQLAAATGAGAAAAPTWLTELNTDPRLRVAAGYGAQIVAADRETLTAAAFDQVTGLPAVNAQLDRGQLARDARTRTVSKHLTGHDPLTTLQLLSPMSQRVSVTPADTSIQPGTIGGLASRGSDARLTPALSTAYRRATRPRATAARHITVPDDITVETMLAPAAVLPTLTPQPGSAADRILLEHVTADTATLAASHHDALRQLAPGVDFDTPMIERLIAFNTQAVLPGAETIPANSAVFLTANPDAVGAFLVGLNWAVQRLLQWRDVPVDRRWTSFRTFWGTGADDIGQISGWDASTGIGGQVTTPPNVILAIRSDLFRRYPTTAIYLVPATAVSPSLAPYPVGSVFPSASTVLPPDLRLLLFDVPQDQLNGYYLVLQEQVTETRFGADPLLALGLAATSAGGRYWAVSDLPAADRATSAHVAVAVREPPSLVAIAVTDLIAHAAVTT